MVDKAEDFLPKVKEIVGDGFIVDVDELSGAIEVIKNKNVILKIFRDVYAGGFVVRVDDIKFNALGKRISEELGIGFVD